LIPNALCSCGKSDETAKHFLLHCKNYIVQRNIFLIGIREISNDLPIDELTLLSGNEILNDEKNTKFFLQVYNMVLKMSYPLSLTVVNKKNNRNKLSRSVANGKQHKHQVPVFFFYTRVCLIGYIYTVVKELRSKMIGQHPGYFKADTDNYRKYL
jgi:hypothetical protein